MALENLPLEGKNYFLGEARPVSKHSNFQQFRNGMIWHPSIDPQVPHSCYKSSTFHLDSLNLSQCIPIYPLKKYLKNNIYHDFPPSLSIVTPCVAHGNYPPQQ
jgi:hypothetical protein